MPSVTIDCCPDVGANSLPTIRLWQIHFRATTAGTLPPLPTTALHGLLGRALWREVCLAPARPTCRGCPARPQCAYPRLLETWVDSPSDVQRTVGVTDEAPRPLLLAPESPLIPTSDRPHHIEEGEVVTFRIGLAGDAAETFRPLIRALRRAGHAGLGSPASRVRLELERFVECSQAPEDSPPHRARIELLTPLRVKLRGRVQPALDATAVVTALVRRAQLLASTEGRAWRPPFNADDVATRIGVVSDLRVLPVSRYSTRQQQRMTWPGLIGSLQLSGAGLPGLWPLLRWGERAQLGKGTTFGFGRYRLVVAGG